MFLEREVEMNNITVKCSCFSAVDQLLQSKSSFTFSKNIYVNKNNTVEFIILTFIFSFLKLSSLFALIKISLN